jgi:hypothetical protein
MNITTSFLIFSKPKNIKEEISIIPKDHQFKAPIGITAIPMFGRHALEGTNENVELDLNSINISSNNSEFGKSLSYNSEYLFSSTTHSSILPKSTRRYSYKKSNNIDPCEKSNNKSLNNSLNNTSVESVCLKVSFDDQEILKDKQNDSTDYKIDSSFKKNTRLSTSQNNSPKNMVSTIKSRAQSMENQKILEEQNNIVSSLANKSKRSTRKLINYATIQHTKDDSFISENKKTINTEENLKSICKSSKINCSFSKQKKTKALRKKTNEISMKENVSFINIEKENSFLLENQKILNIDLESTKNARIIDSILLDPNKSTLSRRSTRMILNTSMNDSVKKCNSILENQKMAEVECNINPKSKNLMDLSLLDQGKTKSPRRRILTKVTNETQTHAQKMLDESLIKFSPRRSVRQTEKVCKLINSSTLMERKKSPKSTPNDQTNFSWSDPLNVSTVSEPIKQKTPNTKEDILQNFSLNLSLTKGSISDKPPAYFSPYIVTSRGKSSVRKEIQRHCLNQSLSKEIPTKDTVMQSLNIFVEEEQRTAQVSTFDTAYLIILFYIAKLFR